MYTNEYQILLESENTVNVTGNLPVSVRVDPSGITTTNFVYKILYDFGDNSQQTVVYTTYPPGLNKTDIDPLFYPVDHTYTEVGTYNINISAYEVGSSTPTVASGVVEVYAPSIYEFNTVASSLYGANDSLLLVLESKGPDIVVPVVATWNKNTLSEPIY